MKSHAAIAAVCARFSGLVMVAVTLPQLGSTVGRIWKHFATGSGMDYISPFVDYTRWGTDEDLFTKLGWFVLFLLGLYLVFGGRLITRLLIGPLLANCQSCGYPLASIKATRCPECGHDNSKPQ